MTRLFILVALATLPALAQPVEFPKPNYCFGFLKAVPDRPNLPAEEAQKIQAAHMAHLNALGEKRWLRGAGPILTPGPLRGILISACRSVAEANELASQDPAVRQGRLLVENYSWTGPAGIGDRYWQQKAQDPQAPAKMQKYALVLLRKSASWSGWPAKEVFAGHFAHAASLRKAGQLVAGGPFHDAGEWLGVYVFSGVAVEEARRLAEQDPLVRGGHARVEAYEWMAADGTFPN